MLKRVRSLRPRLLSAAICVAACQWSYGWADSAPVPSASCEARPAAVQAPDSQVIARIADAKITEADIIDQDRKAFDSLDSSYALKMRQLQLTHDQERYALLKQKSDRLLDSKALELEAKARHKDGDALLAGIKVDAVTDRQARDYYEANKYRTTQSYEDLRAEITQHLANQHNSDATRRFYDDLRARHHIVSLLEPYRLQVDATGPVRGKERAPVTVVEFADFECPFCRQAEETLRAILAKHPDDVRVVFRELPLASIHPNAIAAARTAVCADRQGKFWPMHDALYGDQTALNEAGLKETAKRIGLDSDAMASCMQEPSTTHTIENDLRAADDLNIYSTPYFLVNGRPIKGNVAVDQFEAIIADELRRSAGNRG